MKTKLLIILILTLAIHAYAGSATWNFNPATNDWNTAVNWTPATVPNATTDTATFGASNTTSIVSSAHVDLASLVFTTGAPPYTFTMTAGQFVGLSFWGDGVRNDSGVQQTFSGGFRFYGNSSAGDNVTYDIDSVDFNGASSAGSASIYTTNFSFNDQSTAGNATIVAVPVGSSHNLFYYGLDQQGTPSAGNAHITLLGGDEEHSSFGAYLTIYSGTILDNGTFTAEPATVAGGSGATVVIVGHDLAGGTFVANGGAVTGLGGGGTILVDSAGIASDGTYIINGATAAGGESGVMTVAGGSAGAAFITLNGGENGGLGGKLKITQSGTGGTARVATYGNGLLNINIKIDSTTIGSIEGDGLVSLGKTNLMIGSNNLSTTFSGTIQDTGSITKIGTGTLTLSGANIYSGATTLSGGALLAANATGSATGTGAVKANSGTLGGSGIISGAVTVGTGSGGGASLAPAFGTNKQVTLTVQSSLTLQADATYTYTFKARKNQSRTDLVIANGITINNATIALQGQTQGRLKRGLVLTVLSNTSANPISGSFSNLADGAIVNVNGNNLQADYQGGDGNDLTLTVVP